MEAGRGVLPVLAAGRCAAGLQRFVRKLSSVQVVEEEVGSVVASGARWVVVADAVVDIDEWLDVHPGGAAIARPDRRANSMREGQ